ncbi:MAG: helix-turn-helix domain-containing protein [Erysipelotrichaceae bacterium]|nr:helix-turn-helix domain-containing protein [Erysipelotrichaceae bacterium]
MTIEEIFLSSTDGSSYEVRLYYNKESLNRDGVHSHAHPAMEISIPETCSGVYTVNGKEYPFQPGDLFFFRSNEPHHISHLDAGEEPVCTGIHFYPNLLWTSDSPDSIGILLRYFSMNNRSFSNCHKAEEECCRQIMEYVKDIQKEFVEKRSEYGLRIKMDILSILISIMRYDPIEIDERASYTRDQILNISQIMSYIDIHFEEDITISQLADSINMSVSYLSHLFSKIAGFSIWDYVVSKRIYEAQKLLLNTNENVITIASRCGFNNSAYFNKRFRELTGMTPKEYRKK